VNINNAEIEPKQNVQELPDEPLDVAQLIDQSLCSVGKGSELTITGRGGLPNSSQQALQENNLWEDWRIVEKTPKNTQVTPPSTLETQTQTTPREFQGWTVNARGNVVLTAQPIIVTPQGDWLPPLGCQHLRAENKQI
jgi:large exoprotein involved in heme utilization and adhesion